MNSRFISTLFSLSFDLLNSMISDIDELWIKDLSLNNSAAFVIALILFLSTFLEMVIQCKYFCLNMVEYISFRLEQELAAAAAAREKEVLH